MDKKYTTDGKVVHLTTEEDINQNGLLFSSGLITGEALIGILLALPLMLNETQGLNLPTDYSVFKITPFGPWPGVILLGCVCCWLYLISKKNK